MPQSYGFIETQGLIGSIEAADAMLKTAAVHLVQKREIGFGLVTVIIEGELGAVQSAVDAGRAAAERVGQFVTSHVIPNPFSDTDLLIMQKLGFSQKEAKKEVAEKKTDKIIKPKITQKKTVKPRDKESVSFEDKILSFLKSRKNGATIDQLAKQIKLDSRETRIILKKLIDQQKIEKVQQRYYIL